MPNCSTCQHSWQCFTEPIKPIFPVPPVPDDVTMKHFIFDERLWKNSNDPVVCQMAKMLKPGALALSDVTELQKTSADPCFPHPLAGARYACNVYRVKDALDADTKTPQDLAGKVLVYPSTAMMGMLNGEIQDTRPSRWPSDLMCLLMPIESVTEVRQHIPNWGSPFWHINFYSPFIHRCWWRLK